MYDSQGNARSHPPPAKGDGCEERACVTQNRPTPDHPNSYAGPPPGISVGPRARWEVLGRPEMASPPHGASWGFLKQIKRKRKGLQPKVLRFLLGALLGPRPTPTGVPWAPPSAPNVQKQQKVLRFLLGALLGPRPNPTGVPLSRELRANVRCSMHICAKYA